MDKVDLTDSYIRTKFNQFGQQIEALMDSQNALHNRLRVLESKLAPRCEHYFEVDRCDISGELCKVKARNEICNMKGDQDGKALNSTSATG